ncbi:hypothetical protein CKO31_17270 [Thiohalocapsa halophila]|uniref:Sulfotransferase n=1 Tax=Thiohalocapsa halophila TaxID=69359 RepID=A0ABS1CKU4_9GAMM|nr:sulfotransferase [Thiohalocapsa halophila]MBK1632459.1 hypothetical protein [Thiohalocapsa halophila]
MTFPNFIFGGAGKSGTTSLYHALKQHPQVFASPRKEPMFFSFVDREPAEIPPEDRPGYEVAVKTQSEYEALFAGTERFIARGEASQRYFSDAYALAKIADTIPHVKLIFFLRNPIERAWSHFVHFRRDEREASPTLLGALEGSIPQSHIYTRTGFYAEWLDRWRERFNADQMYVGLFDDFRADAERACQEVYEFLGVDRSFAPDTGLHANISGMPRNWAAREALRGANRVRFILKRYAPGMDRSWMHRTYTSVFRRLLVRPTMDAATREYLLTLYEDDIRRLETILCRDLSHWRAG